MSQRRNRLAGLEATEGVTQCGDAEKQEGLNLPVRKRKEKKRKVPVRVLQERDNPWGGKECQRCVRRHHGRNGYGRHARRRKGGVALPECEHLRVCGGARHVGMERAK